MKKLTTVVTVCMVICFVASAQAAPFKMRISHQMPDSHFLADEIKTFKALVEEKTAGTVQVEIYPAAQAFKEKEVIGAVVSGSIEGGVSTNFAWSGIIPAMDTFLIPFFITEIPVIDKVIHGKVGATLFGMMEEKGVVPIMWLLQTRTNIYTSNDNPLLLPEDFKGKKMRGTSKIMNLGSEAMGASTMSISGPEVYQALQRGTLDVGLTGVDAAFARHYYEVQKYGTAANTFSVVHVVFLNPGFWQSLPTDLQKKVRECALTVQKKSLNDSEAAKENALVGLKEKMTIHIQTDAEEQAWREVMTKPVLDYYIEKLGTDGQQLVKLVEEIKR